jgi:hypothetical protein
MNGIFVDMDVIGVGFGRTGTLSLKEALEDLGFGPCYHMLEVIDRPDRAVAWIEAATEPSPDWDQIFAGYRSTVDWPGAAFWRPLAARYPDARIVLTVRDPDRWYTSVETTIYRQYQLHRDDGVPFARMVGSVVWDGVFGGRFDRESAIARFHRHVAEVRETIAAERLLIYEVGAGWGPLCDFLGVPAPARDFPRNNDTAAFAQRMAQRQQTT